MIIRQKAFEKKGKMQKVALHCHSNKSDGKLPPEEVLTRYAEKGFDLVALTDHRKYNRVNYAPETGIVVIPAMEINVQFDYNAGGTRHFHTLVLGPDDDTNGYAHDDEVDGPDIEDYTTFQERLDEAHAKNNLTIYCHPEWSRTPAKYFEDFKGNVAMEIWNTGSAYHYDSDNNAPYWNEVIAHGNHLFGVATDDAHTAAEIGRGWVMASAEKNVKSVLDALKEGAFYSSCGPIIRDFYFDTETNTVHVETDGVAKVWVIRDRQANTLAAEACKNTIITASYKMSVSPEMIRICVVDRDGRRAWTNPLFLK